MIMLLVFIAAGRAQTNNPPGTNGVTEFPDDSALLPGLMVYQKNCVMCHGSSGDGRGEMGLTVQPRPRDSTPESAAQFTLSGQSRARYLI